MESYLHLLALIGIAVPCLLGLFHTSVYTVTSTAAAQTDVDMPAVADPAVTVVNGHPIFELPVQAIAAYGVGDVALTRLKLATPKLRATSVVDLQPLDVAAAPTNRPPLIEFFRHPLNLNPIDENQLLVSNTVPVGAVPLYGGIWYGNGNMNAPMGDVFTVFGSATITSVANNWVAGGFTLASPLPAGVYSVIGLNVWSTAMLFARLVFPNQSWRPGVVAGAASTWIGSRYFRWGRLGEYGRFSSFAQPNIDIFCSTAGAKTVNIWLDLVRVGGPQAMTGSNLINQVGI